jgi:adenylate kinase family enzyme
MNPQRIMIFGRPGSGKSTFAVKLAQALNLPIYHLDKLFFTHNWIERDHEEFLHLQAALVNQNKWIIDGNSLRSLEVRYERADYVLCFMLPRWQCLWRIVKRRFGHKNPNIDDRAANCPEVLRFNLLQRTWTYDKRLEVRLSELGRLYSLNKVIFIQSDADKNKLFEQLMQKQRLH